MGLEGKVALITGGGAGIGRESALRLAHQGARVAITDTDQSAAQETTSLVNAAGGEAVTMDYDAGSRFGIKGLVHAIEKELGALHFAVNNVPGTPDYCLLHEIDEAGWDRGTDRTLKCIWLAMKYEIPAIKRSGGGAIVNVASISGVDSAPGLSALGAAKAGVISLTKSAAAEVAADNLRVNCITPGAVLSESLAALLEEEPDLKLPLEAAHAMGRLASPEEIANCIHFLCSSEVSFMTGENMVVDGGSGVMPRI